MKLPAPAMRTVPTPVNFSSTKPSPPLRPALNPLKAMSKWTVLSAKTNESLPAIHPRLPSSSSSCMCPGMTPANETSPGAPWAWK